MSDIIPEGILYGNLGVGSGTTNYNDLDNKPQINSVTLQGNKTASELGLVGTSDIPVTSVNGETGAVVLDGTEIEFSEGVSINEKIIAVEQEIPVIAYPVTSVNSKTGAVVLDGTDINYQAGVTINQKIDAVEAEIPVISYPVTSVNGETGAVVLDGTDIEYSSGVSVNSQIDTLMQYTPVYGNTASGAIATFDTSLALPLQDLQIAINAVQESGTPTPSSPKLISGFTGANIKVAGNLLNENNKYQFSYNTVMLGESAGNTYSTHLKATTYTISFKRPTSVPFKVYYNKLGGSGIDIMTYGQKTSASFTVAEEGDYRFVAYYNSGAVVPTDITEIMLVAGSDVKPYQAYTAPTTTAITWQSEAGTVYGGSLDVTSGRLTVTYSSVDLGSLTWSDANGNLSSSSGIATDVKAPSANTQAFNGLCSCYEVAPRTGISDKQISVQTTGNIVISDTGIASMTGAQIKSYVTGFILVYELATPVTYQLTPTQISAIVGTNNVFTDTNGNTSVVYACSLKDYIDSQ